MPDIMGTMHAPETDIAIGLDVVVYTESKSDRPWLGRVCEIFEETLEFQIHWYQVKLSRTFIKLIN